MTEVPEKVISVVDQCCRYKSYKNLSLQTQRSLYELFYNGENKSLQDSYLASLNCASEKKGSKCKVYEFKLCILTF